MIKTFAWFPTYGGVADNRVSQIRIIQINGDKCRSVTSPKETLANRNYRNWRPVGNPEIVDQYDNSWRWERAPNWVADYVAPAMDNPAFLKILAEADTQ